MPSLRTGNAFTLGNPGEITVDVRNDFYDSEYNEYAREEAMHYVPVVVAALEQGHDVLVKCTSGLARSRFVAFLSAQQLSLSTPLDLSFVRTKRAPWLCPFMQKNKKRRGKKIPL